MEELVTYERRDGIARITINDGKVNVMSLAMLEALHAAFDHAARDQAIALLSSSREGIFTAGFDLKVFAANDVPNSVAMVRCGAELALKLFSFPFPVISVCQGHAYPMGAFLLLASDLRIGVEGNYRIGLNEVAIGIPVPSFALELARARLHPAWLSRTATTGEMYGPADATAAGFLDRVVTQSELPTVVASTAAALKQIHMPSHATVKQRLRGGAMAAIRAAIESEQTVEAYLRDARSRVAVRLPGAA